MATFDIGDVPQGWTPGSALRVRKASPNAKGQIMEAELPLLDGFDASGLAYLSFHWSEGERVNAWLDWWDTQA
jgi:hypothetical protein